MRRPASDGATCLEHYWTYGSPGCQRRAHWYRGQRSRRLALKLSLITRTSLSDNLSNALFQFANWHVLKGCAELLWTSRARSPLSVEPCEPLEIPHGHQSRDRNAGLFDEHPGLLSVDLVDEAGELGLNVGNLHDSGRWFLLDHVISLDPVSR